MTRRRHRQPSLDVDVLPAEVSAALEAGEGVRLTRSGDAVGTLRLRPDVLEGTVVQPEVARAPTDPAGDGVTVVATAMRLSDAARHRLTEGFGTGYVVLDVHDAPSTADVLLTHPVSPQLIGILRHQFPSARVVITEIEDDELDMRLPGPVGRLLDAGASAYVPSRPVAEVAAQVHAYLTSGGESMLEPGGRGPQALTPALPPPSDPDEDSAPGEPVGEW